MENAQKPIKKNCPRNVGVAFVGEYLEIKYESPVFRKTAKNYYFRKIRTVTVGRLESK